MKTDTTASALMEWHKCPICGTEVAGAECCVDCQEEIDTGERPSYGTLYRENKIMREGLQRAKKKCETDFSAGHERKTANLIESVLDSLSSLSPSSDD